MKDDLLMGLWSKAVRLYAEGQNDPATLFNEDETRELEAIGVTAHEVYDFAEDFADYGEPDFEVFAGIHEVRREYFGKVQKGRRSHHVVDPDTLPLREAEVDGIAWLPRILVKAKAKLRGELHPDIMYCCAGDRAFLVRHQLDPIDFLRTVWENESDDAAVVKWVQSRSAQTPGAHGATV